MKSTVARIVGRAMAGIWVAILAFHSDLAIAQDEFEQPPINYSASTPDNRVSRLQAAIDREGVGLRYDAKFGYLPDLLKRLEIPVESQMLVFSKTSLQRERIAPRTPRALYFNDDVYVGYCHNGKVLEISAADPQLGAVFYSLEQDRDEAPALTRETQSCLQCHVKSQTDGVPGHIVRSLFVDSGGQPILSEGSHSVDDTTPIENRWGGWYVTGTHGQQAHMGNLIIPDRDAAKPWSNDDGRNVTDLGRRIRPGNYPTPHSDIVALLVFEHQTHIQNLMTKASYATRQALHYEAEFNKALGEPATNQLESTSRRIEGAGEKLLRGLLLVEEAPIQTPIAGTSGFAESFPRRGPRDTRGRSLRDLDLKSRLFLHPCSYQIYSSQFDALPPRMKQYISRRLHLILDGQGGKPYESLTPDDRKAISEILAETKPDLWNLESK
ncbi:hypothetical protein [Singulisphaera sp. PoT]|uniref:hypothetical protein n=1 Tax=Singulisphaera sp. PoT TaxID=3411797 RepID=UPI003BF5A2F9